MTTLNRIRLYAGILAVLVALFAAGAVFGPRRARLHGQVYPGVEVAEVTGVEISSTSTSVAIRREGESWVIQEGNAVFPARSDRIDSFVGEAISSSLVRRITGNDALWGDFGLTDGGGTRVTIDTVTDKGEERTLSAVWGAASSEPGMNYVRRPDAPDVYSSDGELGFYVGQPASYWSYLRVLPEDVTPGDVVRLASDADMQLGDGERRTAYRLSRSAAETSGGTAELWTADGWETPLDETSVTRLLREVVDVVGSDFHRGEVDSGTLGATGTITVSLSDGRAFRVEILQSEVGYLVRADGPALPGDAFGGLLYTLSESTVRRLFPFLEDLQAE